MASIISGPIVSIMGPIELFQGEEGGWGQVLIEYSFFIFLEMGRGWNVG